MLRAGLIRKLAAGLYTWMPLGLRALRKVENIVREEMNRAGALEILMPGVIPAELWEESGRWEQFGPELLRLKDRHERDFCLGPTHEEVVTDIARQRTQELPPAAGEFLPDPDEVPRREPAAFRRDARARIPDEGRLFLPSRSSRPAAGLRRHASMPTPHLHAARPQVPFGASPTPARSAAALPRNSTCSPIQAKTRSRSPTATITPPTSKWRWPCRRAHRAPRPAPPMTEVRDARAPGPSRKSRSCSNYLPRGWSRPCWSTAAEGGVVALLVRGDHELNAVKAQKLAGVAQAAAHVRRTTPSPRRPAASPASSGRWASRAGSTPTIRCCALRDFVCGANKNGRASHRRELGPRSAGTRRGGHPQCRRRRSLADRQGQAIDRARHRSRPHLPARPEVQRGHGSHRARRNRQGGDAVHGLLRNRCDARRGGGHRAEP